MSWTILIVFSKITSSTKAALQWNCLIHVPTNPKRWSTAGINWTSKTWGLERADASEGKEASGSEHSSLTLQASPESRGRAGSHSHGHTSTHPSTSQAPLFRSAGSPLLARALSSCGAWGLCGPGVEPVSRHGQADSYPLDRQEVPPTWKHWASHYGSREVLEECNSHLPGGAVMASTNTTAADGAGAQHSERRGARGFTPQFRGCTEKGAPELTLRQGRDSAARERKGVLACRGAELLTLPPGWAPGSSQITQIIPLKFTKIKSVRLSQSLEEIRKCYHGWSVTWSQLLRSWNWGKLNLKTQFLHL